MKKLFSLKFLLHRIVNIVFYLIFIAIGFVIGYLSRGGNNEKIDNIVNTFIK